MKNIEILLREHIPNLGRCGDVVRVRPGHARNFLFPRKLAVTATDENKRLMARRRTRLDAEEAVRNQALDVQSERLTAMAVSATAKADEHGQLYGSVNAAQVAEAIRSAGHEGIDAADVRLDAPIRKVGTHQIKVHLHAERFAEVTLEVVAEA